MMHLFISFLFLALTLSLSSCPSGGESLNNSDQDTLIESTPTSDSFIQTGNLNEGEQEELEKEPVEIISTDQTSHTPPPARKEDPDNNDQEPQEPVRQPDRPRPLYPNVIITQNPPLSDRSTSMIINSAKMNGSVLELNISYSGGCEGHIIELFAPSNQPEAGVKQVYLTDKTNDKCKKLITEQYKFDIGALKSPDASSLLIRINDHKPAVQWNYGRN